MAEVRRMKIQLLKNDGPIGSIERNIHCVGSNPTYTTN
jgi:hypothetical protein